MSDNEERRVNARHDVTQFYQRKKNVSRKEMPRGVMTISGDPNPDNSSSSSDDDIEDDTYVRRVDFFHIKHIFFFFTTIIISSEKSSLCIQGICFPSMHI
jgi:hypothetical protein